MTGVPSNPLCVIDWGVLRRVNDHVDYITSRLEVYNLKWRGKVVKCLVLQINQEHRKLRLLYSSGGTCCA